MEYKVVLIIIFVFILFNKALNQTLQCYTPDSITKCGLPPTLNENKTNCNLTLTFLNCMNDIMENFCLNYTLNRSNQSFYNKLKYTIKKFNLTYAKNCNYETVVGLKVLNKKSLTENEEECPEQQLKKCEPKSLHITCGYPAANPNSNLNAYCNELKHYIRCANCKTINCDLEPNIVSIRRHLNAQNNNYNEKCASKTTSTIPSTTFTSTSTTSITITSTPTTSTTTTTTTTTTISTIPITTTETQTDTDTTEIFQTIETVSFTTTETENIQTTTVTNIITQTKTKTKIKITTSTSTSTTITTFTTITSTTSTTTTSTATTKSSIKSTTTIFKPKKTTKSKMQEHLDKIISQNLEIKQNLQKTTTTIPAIIYSTTTEQIMQIETLKTKTFLTNNILIKKPETDKITSQKLEHILINFDFIDFKKNQFEVQTSFPNLIYPLKIQNRTDIFKGIKSGAVYLHSKTSFSINLFNRTNDLCLTSSFDSNMPDLTCTNGFSVSFWIKISYLNLFDKTLLKIDNLIDNKIDDFSKFFQLRISSYELKLDFLYKRKLWSINQSIIWKSEWTMFTLTWSEFEGITIYVNGKKLFCNQLYDYYSSNDIYGTSTAPSNKIEDIIDQEKLERYLEKRSFFNQTIKPTGIIYIGLNNKVNKNQKKFYWNFRDQQLNNQNVNITSSFSESILLDELLIINRRLFSKDILNLYLKDYSIKSEFDSVEEKMYLISTDSKQVELLPLQGAMIKKNKDNWYFNLNGDKQFVLIPSLFDSCIIDAENLCSFGFSVIFYIKFLYNFKQFKIENNFKQNLFFIGKQDFSSGLEVDLNIVQQNNFEYSDVFDYYLTIHLKSEKYELKKIFRIFLIDIYELNNLNCLTIQFTDLNNVNLIWLNRKVVEVEYVSFDSSERAYDLSNLKDMGLKTSILSGSKSIGVLGSFEKDSFFSIQNLELKNYLISLDRIEYDYESSNPTLFEFDSIDKLNKIQNLIIDGQPTIVDSKYGKSLLLSSLDQKLIFKNVSDKCFGNLNLCKNGYTLKLWLCFTNYNSNKNVNKKIYIISNGAQNYLDYSFSVYYDLNKSNLIINLKSFKKVYHIEYAFKIKYFIWYTITITYDALDGLRLYINNKLLDHSSGTFYKNYNINYSNPNIEFTIGKSIYDLEDYYIDNIKLSIKDQINVFDQLDNQTEETEKNRKFITKNFNLNSNKNYQSSYSNTNEFIIHKIIQYNVRKYPDEIITRNIIIQEESLNKKAASPSLFWYTMSFVFLSVCCLFLVTLSIILIKRRASNGFWSRENDLDKKNSKKVKKNSSLCCTNGNDEDVIDANKINTLDLELKNCNLKVTDRLSHNFNCDDYTTNSLYGTIDRLIVKKSVCLSTSANMNNNCQTILYTNNYNSLTKDPKLRNSTSYINSADDDILDKTEIHF